MKKILYSHCLWLIVQTLQAQSNFEIQEFTGTVDAINPGFRFAYEEIVMNVKGVEERFMFYPEHGDFILNAIKVGDGIAVKVKVNVKMRESFKKLKEEKRKELLYFQRDYITEIKINNQWVELAEGDKDDKRGSAVICLDRKVEKVFSYDGYNRALTFDSTKASVVSWVSKTYNPMKDVKVGDPLSLSGWKFSKKSGYRYPIDKITDVYSYYPLTKNKGVLKSYLYKQNNVCIGAKFLTKHGEMAVSFPSDKARDIINFLKPEKDVYFYLYNYTFEDQLTPPELHALIQDADTLLVGRVGFYGGADVAHKYKPAEIDGKITAVNRLQSGRIYSVIVDNSVFVEIDPRFEKQIGNLLKRGKLIVTKGDERIKIDGEVYSKDYRIITPYQITVDGNVYVLNQLP